ncbi:PBECR3 domain-containing polyvalent protein [Streptococcus zhangguiae]|uniref:Dihydroorotate dehydrogenase n=1 Tax=Streptococcus zhangguiae TaxID=2664091 RepID=A0A6I4REN1_9STRE|nr:PBECR2 nuclease fold domain-containing protein [Streptococcus sp. zg-70]MWV57208.1 dihydroorotate dehydrogenase [Streptococcus sp. zg-70]
MKKVGQLTKKIIEEFGLSFEEGTEILLSSKRKKHMEKHRDEFSDFEKTFERIDEIVQNPDYVGRHPNGQSLEYIKKLDGNVLVAVRLSEKLSVRTMYVIKDTKLENYLKAGRTKKI